MKKFKEYAKRHPLLKVLYDFLREMENSSGKYFKKGADFHPLKDVYRAIEYYKLILKYLDSYECREGEIPEKEVKILANSYIPSTTFGLLAYGCFLSALRCDIPYLRKCVSKIAIYIKMHFLFYKYELGEDIEEDIF